MDRRHFLGASAAALVVAKSVSAEEKKDAAPKGELFFSIGFGGWGLGRINLDTNAVTEIETGQKRYSGVCISSLDRNILYAAQAEVGVTTNKIVAFDLSTNQQVPTLAIDLPLNTASVYSIQCSGDNIFALYKNPASGQSLIGRHALRPHTNARWTQCVDVLGLQHPHSAWVMPCELKAYVNQSNKNFAIYNLLGERIKEVAIPNEAGEGDAEPWGLVINGSSLLIAGRGRKYVLQYDLATEQWGPKISVTGATGNYSLAIGKDDMLYVASASTAGGGIFGGKISTGNCALIHQRANVEYIAYRQA